MMLGQGCTKKHSEERTSENARKGDRADCKRHGISWHRHKTMLSSSFLMEGVPYSMLRLDLDSTIANGLHERSVIPLGLIGVGHTEPRDSGIEDVTLAEIPGYHFRIS